MLTELNCDLEEVVKTSWFLCFYMIDQLFVREKVENWIFVSDLGGLSLSKIPTKHLKKFMLEAQEFLKCRLRKFFYFNTTFGLRAIFAIISPFLDKVVREKTCLKKGMTDPQLLKFAHPSQIEKKFGGEAENLTEFWPPVCPSTEYSHDPD